MSRVPTWIKISACGCLLAVSLWATQVNIAPDAVTRATLGYNEYIGELAYLTDGLHPDNHDDPGFLAWPNNGNLVFWFDEPRQVSALRLYVGDEAGYYYAVAYLGATFGDTGQTDTMDAELVADAFDYNAERNTWVELTFPPGTETDYIELDTQQGARFYEIEIIGVASQAPTAVQARSWGEVKQGR